MGKVKTNMKKVKKINDWPKGKITRFVGYGSCGMTLVGLEIQAQAYYNLDITIKPLRYHNVEGIIDFPIDEMYGNGKGETCQD